MIKLIRIAIVLLGIYGSSSFAADAHVLIEPTFGYQSISRTYPTAFAEGLITYGIRVVVGTPRLAGELELQYGSANATISSLNETTNTILVQGRLGPRTVVPLSEEFQLIFRGGLQIFRFSDDITNSTSTTWYTESVSYEPYIGAGVNFFLFRSLSLSVEEVYVLNTSFETGLGFRLFI